MNKEQIREVVNQASKDLVDKGKIIEAGWVGYLLMVLPENASQVQKDETRKAFFAGAQHLWGSMFSFLEPDAEPTENDMRRMDMINKELNEFVQTLKNEMT